MAADWSVLMRKLSSEKAAERKSAVTEIKRCLLNAEVLGQLDMLSGKGKGKASFTWERLAQQSSSFCLREFDYQKKLLKKDPSGLFKSVLKAGNRKGPVVSLKCMVDHVVQALDGGQERRAFFIGEAISILQRHVLEWRKYRNGLSQKQFNELVCLLQDICLSSQNVDKPELLSVLKQLIARCSYRVELSCDTTYCFLSQVLSDIHQERNHKTVEAILSLCNICVPLLFHNARGRLCRLGEPLLSPLLHLWPKSMSSVKKELIDFLRNQLRCHFPYGFHGGSSSVNKTQFQEGLQKLYFVILEEFDSLAYKLHWSSDEDTVCDPETLELAVDVIHTVNCLNIFEEEVPEDSEPQGKRLRKVMKWTIFSEQLRKNKTNPSIVTWLRILSRMLEKWFGCFPQSEVFPLCELFLQLLSESKRSVVLKHTMKCLSWIVSNQAKSSSESSLDHQFQVFWKTVWQFTIRVTPVCLSESLQLLALLLKFNAVNSPDSEHWKLFVPGFSPCSQWHVDMVAVATQKVSLTDSGYHGDPFSIRKSLMRFLLSVDMVDLLVALGNSDQRKDLPSRTAPHKLACVLVSLTQSNCSLSQLYDSIKDMPPLERSLGSVGYNDWWEETKDVHLISSFNKPLKVSTPSQGGLHTGVPSFSKNVQLVLLKHLLQLLDEANKQLLETSETGISEGIPGTANLGKHLEALAYQCSLIVSVHYFLLLVDQSNDNTSCHDNLLDKVVHLMVAIERGIRSDHWSAVNSRTRHSQMSRVIQSLLPLVSLDRICGSTPALDTIYLSLNNKMPISFIKAVTGIANGKWFPPSKDSQRGEIGCSESGSSRHSSRSSVDEVDLLIDGPPPPATSSSDKSKKSEAVFSNGTEELLSASALDIYSLSLLAGFNWLVTWLGTTVRLGWSDRSGAALAAHNSYLTVLEEQNLKLEGSCEIHRILMSSSLLESHSNRCTPYLSVVIESIKELLVIHFTDPFIILKCMEVLTSAAEHIALVARGNSSSTVLVICQHVLSVFWNYCLEGRLSPFLRVKLVECFHGYLMVDREGKWSNLTDMKASKGEDGRLSLSEIFLTFLLDQDHIVRVRAAQLMPVLFQEPAELRGVRPVTRTTQESIFSSVKRSLSSDPKLLKENLHPHSKEDESVNFMISRLLVTQVVACVSPACELKVLKMIFAALGRKLVNLDLVQKMLLQVARYHGYTNGKELLVDHLRSIISRWLTEGLAITDFPFQLLELQSTNDFFKEYSLLIVPQLVLKGDIEQVRQFGTVFGHAYIQLLRDCLPECMLSVMPIYGCQQHGLSVSESRIVQASTCHNTIIQLLGEQESSKCLNEKMVEFVVELLSSVYEPEDSTSPYQIYFSFMNSEPNLPHYTVDQIHVTLQYICQCYSSKISKGNFIATLSTSKDSIHRVLQGLAVRMNRAKRLYQKSQLFCGYFVFVDLLCQEMSSGLNSTAKFVIYFSLHTTLNFLQGLSEKDGQLIAIGCDVLLSLCRHSDPYQVELDRHLPLLVNVLVTMVNTSGRYGNKILSVLEYVFSLKSCQEMPIIPEEGLLRDLAERQRQDKSPNGLSPSSLKDILNTFVKRDTCNVEVLKQLRECIAVNKCQILEMFQDDEFSNNAVLINKVLQKLLTFGSCKEVNPVIREATRCLGEIGVVDVPQTALAPPTDTEKLKDISLGPQDKYVAKILELLSDLLVDKDVSVVEAASQCLYDILRTSTASSVLVKLESVGSEALHWCSYLEPFKSAQPKVQTSSGAAWHSTDTVVSQLDVPALWNPWFTGQLKSYTQWLTDLVLHLLKSSVLIDEVLRLLYPVCSIKLDMCESVCPFIVHHLLSCGDDERRTVLSKQFVVFFKAACIHGNQEDKHIATMIRIILFLRSIPKEKPKKSHSTLTPSSSWESNFWLDIDYITVAGAALISKRHITSLMSLEIAIHQMMESSSHLSNSDDFSMDCSSDYDNRPAGCLPTTNPALLHCDKVNDIHSLLMDIYSNIDEVDGLYGVYAIFGNKDNGKGTEVEMYEHEGKWLSALEQYSMELKVPNRRTSAQRGLLKVVQRLGWLELGVCGLEGECDTEYQCEMTWRGAMWDEEDSSLLPHGRFSGCSQEKPFSFYLSHFIASLRVLDVKAMEDCVEQGRSVTVGSDTSLYRQLTKYQCLLEMEEVAEVLKDSSQLKATLSKWSDRLTNMTGDFTYIEPVLSLRCVVIKSLLAMGQSRNQVFSSAVDELYVDLSSLLLHQAKTARKAGHTQMSKAATFALRHTPLPSSVGNALQPEVAWCRQIQEAELHWTKTEPKMALQCMKQFVTMLSKDRELSQAAQYIYPSALCLYGNWLAETRAEPPNIVLSRYLKRAVDLRDKLPDRPPSVTIATNVLMKPEHMYIALARFSDGQYQNIVRHMKSDSFERQVDLLKKSKIEMEHLSNTGSSYKPDASRNLRQLKKHSEEDQIRIQSLLDDKLKFLNIAVENYIKCLSAGDEGDLCVFRLCSLWFENSGDPSVNEMLMENLKNIKSQKFIPLVPQLVARIGRHSSQNDTFQTVLQEVIFKVSHDHPHHAMPVLLAICNAGKDDLYPLDGYQCGTRKANLRRSGSLPSKTRVDEDKTEAAGKLVSKLKTAQGPLIKALELLSDSYIELAYHDAKKQISKKQNTPHLPLPPASGLLKYKPSHAVAMPTLTIPIDPACRYDNIVCIVEFDSSYRVEGGINMPKVLSCLGSDGIQRRQLLKGRDDLRQDAVMQQVFVLVNQLLKRNAKSCKRKLKIRTYKVIPLSQRSGIVEWCEETTTFGNYLVGRPRAVHEGAHSRYRPHDWTNQICRRKLDECNKKKESKLKVFRGVMDNFKPVLHHFFFEKYQLPSQWFLRRLAYTRSVATSSIVGYIVGLGDRHVQNILINVNTAEVIHIDFGVAFEQGKTLPTPETIPFRLTRDVIDGMGVTGVEGVFRQCCEETLATMKASKEDLKTIVEVLLHDPLYIWTVTPRKALDLQRDNKDGNTFTAGQVGNLLAELEGPTQKDTSFSNADRVLLRLQEKLDGYEEGVSLSTSGQVNYLIQSATDVNKLAQLFPGWQAWV